MENGPVNEFNSIGAPSEAMKRKLLYLAETGSESVLSGFRSEAAAFNAGHNKNADSDAHFMAVMEMVMASQERIEQFRERLDFLDQASLEALYETEEQLRAAEERLQDIQDRAYEVTLPDGTVKKVYRDQEVVRDDEGSLVSPEIVGAQDIPASRPTWEERLNAGHAVHQAKKAYDDVVEYRQRLNTARERLNDGNLTDDEIGELETGIVDQMPEAVRRHYEAADGLETPQSSDREQSGANEGNRTFQTGIDPTRAFNPVAAGLIPDSASAKPHDEIKPDRPDASSPSPM